MKRMTTQLRALVKAGKFLELPAVHDPLGAKLAESIGFKTIYNGGFVTGGSTTISEPLLTMTEQITVAANMAKAVNIPVIMDAGAGASLRDAGMIAIRLTAQSTTNRKLVVRASDTRLQFKDSLVVEPARVSAVLSILDQTSQSGAIAAGFIGPFAHLISMSEQESQQKEREQQSMTVGRSLFLDRMLSKGKEETGIVPFLVPNGTVAAERSALTVWVVDPVSADGVKIEVPLLNMPKVIEVKNSDHRSPSAMSTEAKPAEQTSTSTVPTTTKPPPKKPDDSASPACFSWGCRSGPPQ